MVEELNNTKIIFAVEWGSKVLGYASSDSDYDIRFVFEGNGKDEIIQPCFLENEWILVDLRGMSKRKYLEQLFLNMEYMAYEMLLSPIVYRGKTELQKFWLPFINKLDYSRLQASYLHKASQEKQLIDKGISGKVRLKWYIFDLWLITKAKFIQLTNNLPPLSLIATFEKVKAMDPLFIPEEINHEFYRLIRSKIAKKKNDLNELLVDRIPMLDQFIEKSLVDS